MSAPGTTYTLSDDALSRIRAQVSKQVRLTTVLLLLVGLLGFGVIILLNYAPVPVMLLFALIYAGFVVAAGWYFGKVQRERWQLYRITVTNDAITREEGGRNTVTIPREEITEMYDIPEGGILIKTERRRKYIHIAEELDDLAAIREHLRGWREFDPLPR